MTNEQKIQKSIELILEYGTIEGDHHKMWLLDQLLHTLSGDKYDQIITEFCNGEDGPDTYFWDTGIAP